MSLHHHGSLVLITKGLNVVELEKWNLTKPLTMILVNEASNSLHDGQIVL